MRKTMLLALGGMVIVGLVGMAQSRQVANAEDLDQAMKSVRAAFGPLRQSIEAQNAAEIASGAEELAAIFAGVQAFWDANDVDAAAAIAMTAHEAAANIKTAADAEDYDAIGTAAQALGGTCRACHTDYREQVSEGVFKIKDGVL